MARNSRSALYINDPVKIVAGVFTVRQALYVAGIVLLTYGLINATGRLPYGQSGLGQLHLLLIVGLPALLTLLVVTFAGSGTVEPYARQLTGYLWRTTLALPRRLTYRIARLARRLRPTRGAPAAIHGPVLVADGTAAAAEATPVATPIRPVPAPHAPHAPYVAPVLMTTPVAQTQRAAPGLADRPPLRHGRADRRGRRPEPLGRAPPSARTGRGRPSPQGGHGRPHPRRPPRRPLGGRDPWVGRPTRTRNAAPGGRCSGRGSRIARPARARGRRHRPARTARRSGRARRHRRVLPVPPVPHVRSAS